MLREAGLLREDETVMKFDHHKIGVGLGFSGALFRLNYIEYQSLRQLPKSLVMKTAQMSAATFP